MTFSGSGAGIDENTGVVQIKAAENEAPTDRHMPGGASFCVCGKNLL